jgi:hypothetical protein
MVRRASSSILMLGLKKFQHLEVAIYRARGSISCKMGFLCPAEFDLNKIWSGSEFDYHCDLGNETPGIGSCRGRR